MNELEELIERARKNLPSEFVQIRCNARGWGIVKSGEVGEDLLDATFEEVIAKLREWVKPKKPATLDIKGIPYSHAEWYATQGPNPVFAKLCKEAIRPYEVQS